MEMKVAVLVLLAASLQASVATPDPDPVRQLRVPRIYNALITTNEKLQPSRAYPHSAPVLQPLGPGFGPPLAVNPPPPAPAGETSEAVSTPGAKNTPTNREMQYPLTFHPRQLGFYPQPFLPYQFPSPYPYAGAYPGVYGYQPSPYQQPYPYQQPSPYPYAPPGQQLPQNFKAQGTYSMEYNNGDQNGRISTVDETVGGGDEVTDVAQVGDDGGSEVTNEEEEENQDELI